MSRHYCFLAGQGNSDLDSSCFGRGVPVLSQTLAPTPAMENLLAQEFILAKVPAAATPGSLVSFEVKTVGLLHFVGPLRDQLSILVTSNASAVNVTIQDLAAPDSGLQVLTLQLQAPFIYFIHEQTCRKTPRCGKSIMPNTFRALVFFF